jgi:hypothetical protein
MKYKLLFLTFSTPPSKCYFSAAAGALFSLSTHCGSVFSCLDVHLMGQLCPICPLKVIVVFLSKMLLFGGDFLTI